MSDLLGRAKQNQAGRKALQALLLTGITVPLVLAARPRREAAPTLASAPPLSCPRQGGLAPDFLLPDTERTPHSLSATRAQTVLLTFVCGCSVCRRLLRQWRLAQRRHPGLRILAITGMNRADAQAFSRSERLNFPVLIDSYMAASRQWRSPSCPRAWIIGPGGRVVYGSTPGQTAAQIAAAVKQELAHTPGAQQ